MPRPRIAFRSRHWTTLPELGRLIRMLALVPDEAPPATEAAPPRAAIAAA
ncbi:hypothetical protein [Jannaschia sp. W003]|nr:hypothetical protein [Jannaschia sp. W003]UWQ21170.1 hypothetical protein K3554_14525 [Jannaschia sp. W003]